jgi:hypothetical protein
MKTLRESWLSYRRDVLPDHAPPVQVSECRRAFYAGAVAFSAAAFGGLSAGTEPTAADGAKLAGLFTELRAFGGENEKRGKRMILE